MQYIEMKNNKLVQMDGANTFMFDGHAVRAGKQGSKPWGCVIDILKALDDRPYTGKKYHVTEALKGLDADKWVLNALPDDQGGYADDGLRLRIRALLSHRQEPQGMAKKFQAWVRQEVLPGDQPDRHLHRSDSADDSRRFGGAAARGHDPRDPQQRRGALKTVTSICGEEAVDQPARAELGAASVI